MNALPIMRSGERQLAHTLLHNIRETTPGGISRGDLMRRKPSRIALTWLGWLLFAAVLIVGVLTWITR